MQTTLQFSSSSTFQEWSNFKGILKQAKSTEKSLLKNGNSSENLVMHLTRQLQGGGIIKGFDRELSLIPAFSRL